MTALSTQGTGLRHVRKTLTFNGTTVGDVGTDTIFTLTGRVWLVSLFGYCTTNLTSGGTPTLSIGVASGDGIFSSIANAHTAVAAGEWLWDTDAFPADGANLAYLEGSGGVALDESLIATTATSSITGGVIIFDAWYRPITNDGALAGDDIDSEFIAGIWGQAMTELAAVPAPTDSVLAALEWLFVLARNKITQTATTQTLRNDADSASIATAAVTDDGTTFTRGEWT